MGGVNALIALSGAPHSPGTMYAVNASDSSARKNCGTFVRRLSSSCGKLNMPSR